jgi:uncharacterized protein YceK
MAVRAVYVAVLLSSLSLAGCGTVANLCVVPPPEGGKSPFGGVRHDVSCIEKPANQESAGGTDGKLDSQPYQQIQKLLCAADLPFSLIGDVVTWPYTATYSFINQPIPVPPMIQAPNSPVRQTVGDGRPPATPLENLPEPRTLR